MANAEYKIGDLASRFGLTVRAIRYYEELGLLKSSDREEGDHRRYPERNLVYLKRIQQLKDYGLMLGEIKEFFRLAEEDRSGESCKRLLIDRYEEEVAKAEKAKLEAERRIQELSWHIEQLRDVSDFFECPGNQCEDCRHGEDCDMRIEDPIPR
jgi:MerR family transcriptional regulator, copper efflux regulator